ncbi:hypothetical protein [Nitrosomonas communis]|uniref:Uncharacterized protein n=1 Tax=Nitrosomonas communis TaxID=44574 RepID=A0A1H2RFK7_9PROT|nr:hypothetical protein [Nitrosomonas communis]SDW18263.1 hypothetical protein SAMN05421882_1004119 [Nitrosomonas communis]
MSHYADLSFSDEEIITPFLFGVVDKHREIKGINAFADRHLRDGFPRLPGYVAYVQRLNRVADVFAPLLALIQQEQEIRNPRQVWLTDSFSVILARQPYLELQDQCCLQQLLACGNRLKHYLPGLKKKQALNVPAKCVLIRGLWCMYSESWLRLCFLGIFYQLALNSH